jgi:hypothetical protein
MIFRMSTSEGYLHRRVARASLGVVDAERKSTRLPSVRADLRLGTALGDLPSTPTDDRICPRGAPDGIRPEVPHPHGFGG